MTKSASEQVLVLIPTYNDFALLGKITAELQQLGDTYKILVVDDGSTTQFTASELASDVLYFRLPANFGIGAATHVGFDHALRHKYRALVRLDADGQHPLKMIPNLLEPINCGEADLVVGARVNRHEGSGIRGLAAEVVRNYLSLVSRLMTRNRTPSDVNSGFFAISYKAMAILNVLQFERYPEPQMFTMAGRQKLTVKEISVQQAERTHGASTITIARALGMFYRFNVFVLGELIQRSGLR
tara:strand:- start:706 stop:1431 length:726 start_codon:yes stop_codon:yes gene_type:complete